MTGTDKTDDETMIVATPDNCMRTPDSNGLVRMYEVAKNSGWSEIMTDIQDEAMRREGHK